MAARDVRHDRILRYGAMQTYRGLRMRLRERLHSRRSVRERSLWRLSLRMLWPCRGVAGKATEIGSDLEFHRVAASST